MEFIKKPKIKLISEEYHKDFQSSLQKELDMMWAHNCTVKDIQTSSNNEYLFATIIYEEN